MRMAKPPYQGVAWRNVRAEVLERDGYACRIRLPKCTGMATQVDHIVAIVDGGDWYEPSNLRASCAYCNAARVNLKRKGGQGTPTPYLDW